MVVIEIIDEANTRRFERISKPVIRIGRALDNDIIIDDLYIDPHHVELDISLAGSWHVVDLDSKNGTQLGRNSVSKADIVSGNELAIGKTRVRVFDKFHQVPSALSLRNLEQLLLSFSSTPLLTGSLVVLAILPSLTLYLQSYAQEIQPDLYLLASFSAVLASVITGAFWSFLAKLLRGQSRIIISLTIAMIFTIISAILTPVIGIIYYNFPGSPGADSIEMLISAVLFGVYLFIMMTLTTRLSQKYIRITAAITTLSIITILFVSQIFNSDPFNAYPKYDGVVNSPQFLLRSGISPYDYLENLPDVFSEADELAVSDEDDSLR